MTPRDAPELVRADRRRQVLTVTAATALVVLVGWWGAALLAGGAPLNLGAPPFYAHWRDGVWGSGAGDGPWWPAVAAVVAVAVAVPLWWVGACARLRWGWVLAGSWAWSMSWATSLAATDGPARVAEPLLEDRFEYLPLARELDAPGAFVDTFVERVATFPTHVRGHPPGAVLAFWGLDGLLPTDRSLTLGLLALAATAAPAALLAVRSLAGTSAARRAAPFVGLAPAAVWIATSADALFAAVMAWAVALAAMSLAAAGWGALALALGAGVAAGAAMTLSWGAPALLGALAALCLTAGLRRRWRELAAVALGALVAPLWLAAAGFDWPGGLRAVREQYLAGVGSERPGWYFALANLAAFAVAVGPAALAGLSTLRDRHLWWPVGGALAGVAVADLSGMSKGEVERIWLPLVPWVVVATASLRGRRWRSGWAAVTMALAVLLQWRLRTPW